MEKGIFERDEAYRYVKSCYNAIHVINYLGIPERDKMEIEDLIKYFILAVDRVDSFRKINSDKFLNDRRQVIILLMKRYFKELTFPLNINSEIVINETNLINHTKFKILKRDIISYLEFLIDKVKHLDPATISKDQKADLKNLVL